MIKTIIIHNGYKKYLEENLKITSQTNQIILVGDKSLEKLNKINNVEFILIDKYLDYVTKNYKPKFKNYSTNNPDFEFFCFARVFILKMIMEELNLKNIFHIDSDNVLLEDINNYPFTEEVAYIVNNNYDNIYRMSSSIHCGLLTLEFCNIFEKLYNQIYVTGEKFNLIKNKILYHRKNNIPGGICDMTFYYLIKNYNYLKVQDLAKPVVIDNKKYVFINNINNGEGFNGKNQYKLYKNRLQLYKIDDTETKIVDNTNEEYNIFNLHFQGGAKKWLDINYLNNIVHIKWTF